MPGPFEGVASSLTVLFPWGSLLQAVATAEPEGLARIRALCRPGATIDVVTAIDPVTDAAELARLGISDFDLELVAKLWRETGFECVETMPLGAEHPYQTTWWRKIRQREGRVAARLSVKCPSPDAAGEAEFRTDSGTVVGRMAPRADYGPQPLGNLLAVGVDVPVLGGGVGHDEGIAHLGGEVGHGAG